MAHQSTKAPDCSHQNIEYHPLDNLPPAHGEFSLLKPEEPHTPRHETSHDALSSNGQNTYLSGDSSLHDEDNNTHVLVESKPIAQHSSKSSTQKFSIKDLVETPPAEPNKFSLRDWQWEFFAAAISLACFTSIVGVLIAYRDKSLSSWNAAFGITLNTLVATLSTLSKTALLVPVASCLSQLKWIHIVTASRTLNEVQVFDDASRGPWGSLTLIWKIHIKAKLAAWGSIITLLALAMSPFAQQLLSFPSRSIEYAGGSFYKSQSYDFAARSSVASEGPFNKKGGL